MEIDVWKEVVIYSIEYVGVRRNGLKKDEYKAFTDLEDAVNNFLSETYDGEGHA